MPRNGGGRGANLRRLSCSLPGLCHNKEVKETTLLSAPERQSPKPGSIRLLATDIDGTLLNPQFQISDGDLTALRRAHAVGVEIVLVTGRRHTFALPIAQRSEERR